MHFFYSIAGWPFSKVIIIDLNYLSYQLIHFLFEQLKNSTFHNESQTFSYPYEYYFINLQFSSSMSNLTL